MFEKKVYSSYLVKGQLKSAIAYLENFEEMSEKVLKYKSTFEGHQLIKRSDNQRLNEIDAIFQEYYRMVFWEEKSEAECESYLLKAIGTYLNITSTEEEASLSVPEKMEGLENKLAALVEKEGYYYLGGTTGSWYGPYIWKDTEKVVYSVELPKGTFELTVNMLTGFVSRSWLDYLSFGATGTGGWATDTELYCVKELYEEDMDAPSFQISYLKHEAQHKLDMQVNPNMDGVSLEYRAKLVELIYYPNLDKFSFFLLEASDENKTNSHAYSSFLIGRELSKRILGKELERDMDAWKGKEEEIKQEAMKLYFESSAEKTVLE